MLLEEYDALRSVLTFLVLFGALAIVGFVVSGVLWMAFEKLVAITTGNRRE
jgi:hypothetical protein